MNPRRPGPLAFAAIVAVVLIGSAVWFTRDKPLAEVPEQEVLLDVLDIVRPVHAEDHVLGNPNAPVTIITYSDYGCEFCKEFHGTLHRIIDKFGKEGDVAWVFRHIPLVQLHPQAPMYALASECVAEHAGNKAFWDFSDALFDYIDFDVTADAAKLLELARDAGVAPQTFTACMRANELMQNVETDFEEAVAAGASASPFTVVMAADQRVAFEGAIEYVAFGSSIQSLIQQMDAMGTNELRSPSDAYDPSTFGGEELMYMEANEGDSLVPAATE